MITKSIIFSLAGAIIIFTVTYFLTYQDLTARQDTTSFPPSSAWLPALLFAVIGFAALYVVFLAARYFHLPFLLQILLSAMVTIGILLFALAHSVGDAINWYYFDRLQAKKYQILETHWKTYKNERYGFEFGYPDKFEGLREYPEGKDCKISDGVNRVEVVSMDNINVSVICENLSSKLISQFNNKYNFDYKQKMETAARRTAYVHEFYTGTNYFSRILQLPIAGDRFIELYYTYKESPQYKSLTDQEWKQVVESFRITQ